MEDDDTVNEEKYEMQVETKNLKGVFTTLYIADGCCRSRDDSSVYLYKDGIKRGSYCRLWTPCSVATR